MLKLLVRDLDICRVSKVLGRNRLKASITSSTIIIDSDEITDEVIDNLFENATIIGAQNYHTSDDVTSMETETKVEKKDPFVKGPLQVAETTQGAAETETSEAVTDTTEEAVETESSKAVAGTKSSTFTLIPEIVHTEETIETFDDDIVDSEYHIESGTSLVTQKAVEVEHPKVSGSQIPESEMVYRGEVYKWGSIRKYEDREGSIKECVIIIQNDYLMSTSDDTIAMFCTSNYEEAAPIRFSFQLTKETMVDHSRKRLQLFNQRTMFAGYIKDISRKRIGKYLGKMNESFMNTLQPAIDFCLGLKRSRTVNEAQLQILSTINIADLFAISDAKISNSEKVTEFLKLFNFDMTKNGMEYVKQAILVAYTMGDYRLEDLAQAIAKEEHVEAEEVLRLIVARIKENFQFRKSPTISFIRLIDKVLKKG